MSKKYRNNNHKNHKCLEYVFYGIVILLVILLVAKIFIPNDTAVDGSNLVITEDGHVHTSDGTHLGTYDEIFGAADAATEDAASTETGDAATEDASTDAAESTEATE